MVFVAGARIEDCYDQILDKWFGNPERVHLDSWMALEVVDGWRIGLSPTPHPGPEKLFFVNLGAYDDKFTELHAIGFYVAQDEAEAKRRAKSELLKGATTVHKDDLHAVDDCIALGRVQDLHVTLTQTGESAPLRPNNGYHKIPKEVVAAYMGRRER